MFRVLPASGAHSREQRTPWTAASILAHAILLALVVARSTTRGEDERRSAPLADPVIYTTPREVRQRGEPPQSNAIAEPPGMTALPTIAIPAVPALDIGPQQTVHVLPQELWRGGDALGSPDGAPLPGVGVYSDRTVDRQVVARSDNPPPDYPAALRSSGLEGEVVVRFVVDTSGHVEPGSIEMIRSTHPTFSDAVRRWLPRTRYAPAEIGSHRVRQLVEQRVGFTLRR